MLKRSDLLNKNKASACGGCEKKTSIGGQALIEGIMMRGPKLSAMAVRDPNGEIILEKWETKAMFKGKFFKLPFVRGIFNFIDSMSSGYKCLMRSAEIAGLEEVEEKSEDGTEKKESGGISQVVMNILMVFSAILGVALAVGLFMVLPTFLYDMLEKFVSFFADKSKYLQSPFEGVLRIIIFLVYMLLVSRMKDIRRTFMYHGAEHKTIFCYEHGNELTVENVRKESRYHPRCGTSFMVLMLIVGIIIGMFIPTDLPTLVRAAIKLLLLPVSVGIGYELIKLAGKHDNVFTRVISKPGMWFQRITTVEPEDDMIECAIKAFVEVLPEDEKEASW